MAVAKKQTPLAGGVSRPHYKRSLNKKRFDNLCSLHRALEAPSCERGHSPVQGPRCGLTASTDSVIRKQSRRPTTGELVSPSRNPHRTRRQQKKTRGAPTRTDRCRSQGRGHEETWQKTDGCSYRFHGHWSSVEIGWSGRALCDCRAGERGAMCEVRGCAGLQPSQQSPSSSGCLPTTRTTAHQYSECNNERVNTCCDEDTIATGISKCYRGLIIGGFRTFRRTFRS